MKDILKSMFEGVPQFNVNLMIQKILYFLITFIKRRIEYYKNYDVCISRFVRTYMCKFMIGTYW